MFGAEKNLRNGAPNVFQTFVSILLKEDHVKWLGEELKGTTHNSCHFTVILDLYVLPASSYMYGLGIMTYVVHSCS